MKITFVTSGWRLSGGDRVIAIYAQRLMRRGHDVLLVAPPPPRPHVSWLDRIRHRFAGQPLTNEEPTYLDPAIKRHRLDRPRPVRNEDVPDADVVIATWWETAEWVSALESSKGAKVFFLQHFEAFDYLPTERVHAVWRLPFHKITISRWLVDLARERFDDRDVSLVFNSVDTDQFHSPPRGRQDIPTIGLLYSDTPWKGMDVCLAAIERLGRPARVVAFGSHAERPGSDGPALPPGSRYYYRPAQDAIRDIYAQCDVWLCGSRGEGFHLPPLEAMACRCPVVSTAVGGPLDIVEDGRNGYVVPIGDVAALADRLSRIFASSTDEWRTMSDNALETARRYSWDDATDLFEAGLAHAIDRRSRGEIQ